MSGWVHQPDVSHAVRYGLAVDRKNEMTELVPAGRDLIPDMTNPRRRLGEAGRIRMGDKSGKAGFNVLTRWRITSQNEAALQVLAGTYGGAVKPWTDPSANPPDQFQLYTETSTLQVYLIPDSLSMSMELWGKGYIDRRCNGDKSDTACTIVGGSPDGDDILCPCICTANNVRECKVKIRLSVLFPCLPPLSWRFESSSWNAMEEMPGQVELIDMISNTKVTLANLGISKRKSTSRGKGGKISTKHFSVPELVAASPTEQILEIQAAPIEVPQLEQAAVDIYAPALPPATESHATEQPVDEPHADEHERGSGHIVDDDGIIDAEIIEPPVASNVDEIIDQMWQVIAEGNFEVTAEEFVPLIVAQVGPHADKLMKITNDIQAGQIIPKIKDGKAIKGRPTQ